MGSAAHRPLVLVPGACETPAYARSASTVGYRTTVKLSFWGADFWPAALVAIITSV
jgi:hypothetical protein